MKRLLKTVFKKRAGEAPGTLLPPEEKKYVGAPVVHMMKYNMEEIREKTAETPDDVVNWFEKEKVNWINIDGLHDLSIIESLGQKFDIHGLVLEDILNIEHRPKAEEHDNYIFAVMKMIRFNEGMKETDVEQVSVILGENHVITFQEKEGDVFNGVRERIRKQKSKIRHMGAEYLFYSLVDVVVDNYFVVLEHLSEKIESLEEEVIKKPGTETLTEIYKLKRELIFLRKSVWPLREIIGKFSRETTELAAENVRIYFKDVYDHTIQAIETIEAFRDVVAGLLDIYLTGVSNKMNEVMKVLTIIATIFIPITFIAGVYGMNFEFMPELKIKWAYPLVWFVMFLVAVVMVVYFKRKKWI